MSDAAGESSALSAAKSVAHAFLKTANPEDEFLLLTVSSLPDAASRFTTDAQVLQQQIDSTRSGGMTALNDTVYLGLSRMREAREPCRALLIFSDGMDNNSRYSKGELMREALEANVQVYTIIVDGLAGASSSGAPFRSAMIQKPWEQAAARQGPMLLEDLSKKTGGLHFHIRNDSHAADAAAGISLALRNEYVIGYQAPSSTMSGKWRHIQIKTSLPNVQIHARDGYYAR
ncbi:MAG: VWA domain-containing protein [Bryobacterales bacterium]|nr:VWA domain-containing protein [Bryobacterales bacterium]